MASTTGLRSAGRLQELAQQVPENTAVALTRLLEAVVANRERAAFAARALDAVTEVAAR